MKTKKRLLGILLSLALILGLMPGMSLTAYATSNKNLTNLQIDEILDASSDSIVLNNDTGNAQRMAISETIPDYTWQYDNVYNGSSFTLPSGALYKVIEKSGGYFTFAPTSHKFTYSASGAVISAVCYNGCTAGYDSENPLTLTISAPTNLVYDGNAKVATITGDYPDSPPDGLAAMPTSISYNTPSGYAPTEAGDYTASFTWGGVTASVSFTISNHTHSFTYSTNGATITATCSENGCTLPEIGGKHVATLTISAPALTNYGGTESAEATITDANSIKGDTTVQYQTKSGDTYGTATTTAPTGAGSHKASITLGTSTASVEYTIAKADPTANAPSATATYGQTLTDVSLTNPTGNTAGTWAFVGAGTTSVGDVGSHTFKANFTPTSTNYKTIENVDVTVTVSKAANPATVTNTASVTKGGNTVDLAGNVTKNGATGDVSYAISGEENGCSLNGSVLTSGNNTGSVTVNVTVAEDDNYNALAATPITVTISDKATQTITAADVTAAYGDTDKSVSASTSGDGAISYAVKEGSADYIAVDASSGALTIKKVGTATVIVTAAETATYAQATKEVTVTINKANAVAATVTANNRTYDGTAQPLVTVTGEPTGGTMQYALGTATEATEDYSTSLPAATDVGTYYVWYKAVGDADHNDSDPGCVTVTISVPEVVATPTFTPAEGTYTEAQSVTITCATEGATIHYTTDGSEPTSSSTTYSSAISVGETTTIKAIAVKDGMTDSEVASATYTISEKSEPGTVATPTFSPEGGTYSDPQMVSINSETSGATIYYTTDGNDPTTESATFSSEITVTETTTIKAIAVKEGMTDSSVASVTYTISEEPEPGPEPEPAPEPTPDGGSIEINTSGNAGIEVPSINREEARNILEGTGADISSTDDVKIIVESNTKSEEDVRQDADRLKEELGGSDVTIGAFIDISVAYTINGGAKNYINKTGSSIVLNIPVPSSMVASGRRYIVYRIHDNVVSIVGTSTTPVVAISSDLFSTYAIGYTTASVEKDDEPKLKPCVHTYEWSEDVHPTSETDGETYYKCTKCGHVLYKQTISAYSYFNTECCNLIKKAPANSKVLITTDKWISVHRSVLEELDKRKDVTLEVLFLEEGYKGNRMSFVIPAGADVMSIIGDDNFVGFIYLGSNFGIKTSY